MSEPKTEVTSINVEILGRRLSFTLEEARALQHVLRDALRDGSKIVEPTVIHQTVEPYTFMWDNGTTFDPVNT